MIKKIVWHCLDQNLNKNNSTYKEEDYSGNKLAIILAYHFGFQYFEEQLASIFNQTFTSFDLYITDDGSDLFSKISNLKLSKELKSKIFIQYRTKNIGHASNFLSSLSEIKKNYDFYGFSDQDDIWSPNKIKNSLDKLKKCGVNIPSLYGARTEYIDKTGNKSLGLSTFYSKKLSFQNALVQNICGGNTMFFNKKACKLIVDSSKGNYIIAHDWWCYLMVSGAGGNLIYDNFISLKYRQHNKNAIGRNNSIVGKVLRIYRLFIGVFKNNNDHNIKALINNKKFLIKENQISLENFIKYKNSKFLRKLYFFKKSGIYRQTFFGNLGLIIASFFNKI